MKGGWHGPVIDTLRNLYDKLSFRVKSNRRISSKIFSKLGVHQGGIASGILFRKYLVDLESYLSSEHGICIIDGIIAHFIWADDLISLSDTFQSLQKQLNGLQQFCSSNHMLVNEIKTKVMVFGNPTTSRIYFNTKIIDEVKDYKYLGNIISSIKSPNQDALKTTYQFLCDQARKAIFSMKTKIKAIRELPPDLMLNLFDTLIKPILIYGSNVWGIKSKLWRYTNKVFLQYARCILRVKATTGNIISVGEYGRLHPSTACHISALCFMNRLHHMSDDKLVKKVYCELKILTVKGLQIGQQTHWSW